MASRQFSQHILTVAVIVGSLVVATSAGSRNNSQSPDVMRVTKLQVMHNGNVVAEISATPDGDGQVIVYDRAGDATQTLPLKPHFRLIDQSARSTVLAKADTGRSRP